MSPGEKSIITVWKHCGEYYLMPPGFVFRGIAIQLKSPLLVGFIRETHKILMPVTKPCYGTMLYEIHAHDEDYAYLSAALERKNAETSRRDEEKPDKKSGHLTEI
jgi:hypothetical protein